MLIKAGTYRFNDVLTESGIELNADIDFTVAVTAYGMYEGTAYCDNITFEATLHNAGTPTEYWYNVMRFNVSELDPAFAYLPTPTQMLIYQTTHLGGGETSGIWETDSYSEGIKTITILNDTEVSDEFGAWFTASTKREGAEPAATITHNGSTLAELFPGQTATLKCKGMKMESDVVVEVAKQSGGGGDANIVPLLVGDSGTYDANSLVIVTETFTGEGEPDAVYSYWGNQLPYFKAKKLVATRDIFVLANNENFADKLYVDLFGDVTPIWQFELNTNFSETSLVIMSSGMPAIIWVVSTDENYFTKEAGFEDGGVYVLDAWSLMGATGTASMSALGVPDKPSDGFMPVTVSIPIEDELVVNIDDYISFHGNINDGILYRKVRTVGMTPKRLTITPTNNAQTFEPESGYFYRQITVEPIDIPEDYDGTITIV